RCFNTMSPPLVTISIRAWRGVCGLDGVACFWAAARGVRTEIRRAERRTCEPSYTSLINVLCLTKVLQRRPFHKRDEGIDISRRLQASVGQITDFCMPKAPAGKKQNRGGETDKSRNGNPGCHRLCYYSKQRHQTGRIDGHWT